LHGSDAIDQSLDCLRLARDHAADTALVPEQITQERCASSRNRLLTSGGNSTALLTLPASAPRLRARWSGNLHRADPRRDKAGDGGA
jgi:hypothetical protein